MLFYISIEHSLLCSFVILLFYYDVLSFCFNILIHLLCDLMCCYAIMLCNFVVLSSVLSFCCCVIWANVTLYDSVLLLCYFVVLSFCFNVLSFRYCSVLSFRPFSRFFCFNFSFSYTILPVSFVTLWFCHAFLLCCFTLLSLSLLMTFARNPS